jgi:anti-anti-sigma factor
MTMYEENHVIVLELDGDLSEGQECDDVERTLLTLAGQGQRMVADLSRTHRLNARGLGMFARVQREALLHGGRLALCNASRMQLWLLAHTHLSDVLTVHADRASAIGEPDCGGPMGA